MTETKDAKKDFKEAEEEVDAKAVVAVSKEETASDDLESKTVTELRSMAKDASIKGYSTMKKDELVAVLSK
ncbi:MAG TPA: Rho termination factor N-terminal domain-containing protein [Bacilli bacterium]|nr:Rho termination factor N-terminal domain-containing protein [Bacilli bacterium]